MNLKNFEKANKLHRKLRAVERDMIEVCKMAATAAQDSCSIDVQFSVLNHSCSPAVNESGSLTTFHLKNGNDLGPFSGFFEKMVNDAKSNEQNANKEAYSFSVTESECLRMIDTLSKIKRDEHSHLVKELEQLGVVYQSENKQLQL